VVHPPIESDSLESSFEPSLPRGDLLRSDRVLGNLVADPVVKTVARQPRFQVLRRVDRIVVVVLLEMPGPDIGLDGGTSVVLEVRGKALPPSVGRIGSSGRRGSVDGEESTALGEGCTQGLGTSNKGLVELCLRSTAKVDVGLVPAFELRGVRVGHPVALDIVNDLLEEGAPFGPVAVVSREREVIPSGLVGAPEVGQFQGKDTIASPYVPRSGRKLARFDCRELVSCSTHLIRLNAVTAVLNR
jgi:hypothetical protein